MQHQTPYLVSESPIPQATVKVHSHDFATAITKACPGLIVDAGARLGMWHPGQDKRMGIRLGHKHICSMDRGIMPQWPEWHTEDGLVEVPLDYAIQHADFPVVRLYEEPEEGEPIFKEDTTAVMLKPQLKSVKAIGWAEVVWHLTKKVPSLDVAFFRNTLRLPMDWIGGLRTSPLLRSYEVAREKGMAK